MTKRRRTLVTGVSIPFIAGQWSLPGGDPGAAPGRADVSIPFIAGQWSLLHVSKLPCQGSVLFQSPSLRGSGRFAFRRYRPFLVLLVSIPFIAGQWSLPRESISERAVASLFQSPSLRGSGRFSRPAVRRKRGGPFQSPSLRGSGRF